MDRGPGSGQEVTIRQALRQHSASASEAQGMGPLWVLWVRPAQDRQGDTGKSSQNSEDTVTQGSREAGRRLPVQGKWRQRLLAL